MSPRWPIMYPKSWPNGVGFTPRSRLGRSSAGSGTAIHGSPSWTKVHTDCGSWSGPCATTNTVSSPIEFARSSGTRVAPDQWHAHIFVACAGDVHGAIVNDFAQEIDSFSGFRTIHEPSV